MTLLGHVAMSAWRGQHRE